MNVLTPRKKVSPAMNRDASPAAEDPANGDADQVDADQVDASQGDAIQANANQANASQADAAGNDSTEANEAAKKRRAATRFLYSTGDRPLEGYTIKRGLGRGGFGEVYFATSDAGKEVAIKLIRRNLDIELRGVRHCLNLKHPNLIGLYDIKTDTIGDEWVVMEYVAGESLDEVLAHYPDGMPVEEATAWVRSIAAGVGHLHQSGIVHRDLKPGNLFLEGRQGVLNGATVKIGDYGLSKFISCSQRSGQTESVGTVHYMAPEISGGRYGREIDTYALGIIFYEMLTGQVPFEGESVGEVLMKHLTAEPDLSRVEEPYRSIIARALAKDPEARLKSVEELVALLPGAQASTGGDEALMMPALMPGSENTGVNTGLNTAGNTVGNTAENTAENTANDGVWRPVSTSPHDHASSSPREPLWEGLVGLTDAMREGWRNWDAPAAVKALAMFGFVIFAFFTSGGWLAIGGVLLVCYVGYYVIWSAFLQDTLVASPRTAQREMAPNGRPNPNYSPVSEKPNAKRTRRTNWRDTALQIRRERPLRARLKSLVGSMLVAYIVAVLVSVFASAVLASDFDAKWQLAIWGSVVITLGSWIVLISNAVTENYFDRDDFMPRRGLLLLGGLLLGLVAYSATSLVGLLPFDNEVSIRVNDGVVQHALDIGKVDGSLVGHDTIRIPQAASIAYFGVLFVVLRWWKSAEYIRRKRVGFWSIALVMMFAWLLHVVTWYPQPLGLLVAGGIAFATQVASPWLPSSQRIELARQSNLV